MRQRRRSTHAIDTDAAAAGASRSARSTITRLLRDAIGSCRLPDRHGRNATSAQSACWCYYAVRRPIHAPHRDCRAAVGYTTVGLRVTVGLCGPARALVAPHTTTRHRMATARPLALLSALGSHTVCTVDDPDTLTRL